MFLAGGLNAGNVADATRSVKPFGVDLCTGVRTGGALDEEKLRRTMEAVGVDVRKANPVYPETPEEEVHCPLYPDKKSK